MSEHLLFLQAAGAEFDKAHDLVVDVAEAIRAPHDELKKRPGRHQNKTIGDELAPWRRRVDPERIAERLERGGWKRPDSLVIALAVHATIASPLSDEDLAWIASAAARIGDADLLRELAGVVFAFNTINRIADARRVQLEYRFLRKLKPIQGWVERRFASLTGLVYDLSYRHHARHTPAVLLDRLDVLFARLGVPAVPDVFHWLSQSPVVLEGVVEMLEANVTSSRVRFDLWKEAAAIAVASRAMPGSGLSRAVAQWLPQGSLPSSNTLRKSAALPGGTADSCLASECRRYSWQVANAAYTISDEQVARITALGLDDAELLDLTLATAIFSALAIIEPISAAVGPKTERQGDDAAPTSEVHAQPALREELAV